LGPTAADGTDGSILILGGTAEGRALAVAATAARYPIVSSLAGRVSRPALPVGSVRIGGFGGPDGLAAYLTSARISAVVDATHPFAARMSANAVAACTAVGVPLLRLARPGWAGRADADWWRWVDSTAAAAVATRETGQRAFLTTGRQTLPEFAGLTDRSTLVRVVEPPDIPLPDRWQVMLDRGPYVLAGELTLMRAFEVDVLVTKDSGGSYTSAKLDAAAELHIPVVVVRRPSPPAGVATVDSVAGALEWLHSVGARTSG
jgi:precorrin-6A/cobalt-precorrin-6A reductase